MVIWLSLDELAPLWKAVPNLHPHFSALQSAARTAEAPVLDGADASTAVSRFADACQAAFPPPATNPAQTLSRYHRILAQDDFATWAGWFSEHKRDPDLTMILASAAGGEPPNFAKDVIERAKKLNAEIAEATQKPLSDWDLSVHTAYGWNAEEDGVHSRSALLSMVRNQVRDLLFATFLEDLNARLPATAQQVLHERVKADWNETLSEPLASEWEQDLLGSSDPAGQAAALRSIGDILGV